jgi:hypothetical protein
MAENDENLLCRKLYEAASKGRGVRLTASEVFRLVVADDAVSTRITNAASMEAIGESWGHGCVTDDGKTWNQFVKGFRHD